MSISNRNTGAVQPLTAAKKAAEASKVQRAEEAVQSSPRGSVRDEYIPEGPQELSGRYWMETRLTQRGRRRRSFAPAIPARWIARSKS